MCYSNMKNIFPVFELRTLQTSRSTIWSFVQSLKLLFQSFFSLEKSFFFCRKQEQIINQPRKREKQENLGPMVVAFAIKVKLCQIVVLTFSFQDIGSVVKVGNYKFQYDLQESFHRCECYHGILQLCVQLVGSLVRRRAFLIVWKSLQVHIFYPNRIFHKVYHRSTIFAFSVRSKLGSHQATQLGIVKDIVMWRCTSLRVLFKDAPLRKR